MSEITFSIDGQLITVPKGTTVYAAAQKLGIDLPIFCYQDRMPPFGACRVCLVEVEKNPKLQASCTLEAVEGMVVMTTSKRALEGRKTILELLLINHPLDCPICDRAGECPLQENALKYGPGESEFVEEKRRFPKPVPLSPLLMLDRERCIVCARCTRFTDIIAGDHSLELIDRGYKSEVGGSADSKFIGNTIKICPVGALTSRVYRFRARPWDNGQRESCCTLCPIGCNMVFDERDGEIVRTRSKENREVNDLWLCDKGWFGYEFLSHPARLTHPLIRKNDRLEPASWEEALDLIARRLKKSKGEVAGWGGNPLTLEENSSFQQLIRQGCHSPHLDHRINMPLFSLEEEGLPPGMELSLGECASLPSALLLGIDLTEEFPLLWLRLKEAINKGAKVHFIGHFAPEIARHLNQVILHPPGQELEILHQNLPMIDKNAVFVGRQYLALPNRRDLLAALTPFQSRNILEGSGNSMGARFAGMRPDLPGTPGLNILQVLQKAAKDGWGAWYIAGANPAIHYPEKLWRQARSNTRFVVVQDLFLTETAQGADVVLPTLGWGEKDGHFLNIEQRLQKLRRGKSLPPSILSDQEIFQRIASRLNVKLIQPVLVEGRTPLRHPPLKVETKSATAGEKAGLRAIFAPRLFNQGTRMIHNRQLSQKVKEGRARLHPLEAQSRGFKNGDRLWVKSQEGMVSAILEIDPKLAEQTVVLTSGCLTLPLHELEPRLIHGVKVELVKER